MRVELSIGAGAVAVFVGAAVLGGSAPATAEQRFELSFPASVHAEPVTGRIYVMVSRTNDREPRLQIGRKAALEPVAREPPQRRRAGAARPADGSRWPCRSTTPTSSAAPGPTVPTLNNSTRELEQWIKTTENPHYEGFFMYGDGKGHCFRGPVTRAERLREDGAAHHAQEA